MQQHFLEAVCLDAQGYLEEGITVITIIREGGNICEGDLISDCARAFAEGHPHLRAIGVNCTKPEYIESLVRELRTATDLPIAVYPNSGETYDPVTKSWHGAADSKDFGEYALSFMRAGATAVGGCCTTVQQHVRQTVAARDAFLAEGADAPAHMR